MNYLTQEWFEEQSLKPTTLGIAKLISLTLFKLWKRYRSDDGSSIVMIPIQYLNGVEVDLENDKLIDSVYQMLDACVAICTKVELADDNHDNPTPVDVQIFILALENLVSVYDELVCESSPNWNMFGCKMVMKSLTAFFGVADVADVVDYINRLYINFLIPLTHITPQFNIGEVYVRALPTTPTVVLEALVLAGATITTKRCNKQNDLRLRDEIDASIGTITPIYDENDTLFGLVKAKGELVETMEFTPRINRRLDYMRYIEETYRG
jgi:hypothetical protein